jgi:hypothetical protein
LVLAKQTNDDDYSIDWDAIAEELDSRRTPFQCFEKYQSELNQRILRK